MDFLFLISVIDGYYIYIVHHELRTSMEEYDVQITIERALDKSHRGQKCRMIIHFIQLIKIQLRLKKERIVTMLLAMRC